MLKPWCCTCETFIRLYIDDTLIKKKVIKNSKENKCLKHSWLFLTSTGNSIANQGQPHIYKGLVLKPFQAYPILQNEKSGKEIDQLMSTIMSKLSTELSLCFCWWVLAEKPSLASDNHIFTHQAQFHLLTLQYTDLLIHSPRPICLSQGKEEKSLPTIYDS